MTNAFNDTHSCGCAFCPEEGGVMQHFTPEKTTATKQRFEPDLGPSAAFLLKYNKGDSIVGRTRQQAGNY